MSSDNTAPILSRADTVNLISSLRFHDCTDDERAAIHLKLTTSDAGLRIEIQRLTEERIKALDAELSALRAELAETKDTLKEHEEEHWCFNAEHGQVIIERDRLRAELEAVKAERDEAKAIDRCNRLFRENSALRVRLEEAERERGKEFYFRFPKSLDLCGPYRSIEEMREDSAWKNTAWTPLWRLKGLAPGPCHEFDRDAAISQTAQPEEKGTSQ